MKHMNKKHCLIQCWIFAFFLMTFATQARAEKGDNRMAIEAGKTVSIEYTLTLEDKKVIDTNVGGKPLTYVQGSNQIIPGLQSSMGGMHTGESKEVIVQPEDAYGPVVKEAITVVDTAQLPEEVRQKGASVQVQGPNGQVFNGQVVEVNGDKSVVDFNHPLAGKVLFFHVKVLDIK